MFRIVLLTSFLLCARPVLSADESKGRPEQLEFVRSKVLPLLESRCFGCHRDQKEHKGGLFLGNRAGALKGGDSGPAIVPGKPDESLVVEAIRYESFEMPPRSRMPQAEVDILVKWIKDGAVWPRDLQTSPDSQTTEFPLQQRKASHWVWQQIADPQPPSVEDQNWGRDRADAFLLSQLQKK